MASGYWPKLDVSPKLGSYQTNYYQKLIGVLKQTIELVNIDIHTGVELLSIYMALPRRGHMEQVFHIFTYM